VAAALSFVLVVVGIVLIALGVVVVIAAAGLVLEEAAVSTVVIVPCLAIFVGLGVVFGGVRFITRVRPWMVRRLCGREVPRIPAPIAAMARGDGGAWS